MQILKTWNIRLLESIKHPQQLNEIASVLNSGGRPAESKKSTGRTTASKSFRAPKQKSIRRDQPQPQDLRRADSFSKIQTYRTDINGVSGTLSQGAGISGGTLRIGGLPPLPREANTKSWGGPDDPTGPGGIAGNLSQDSFFTGSFPPPLPPRPSNRIKNDEDDDDEYDPDYAYIKEDEVKGPKGAKQAPRKTSGSVDDVLDELEQDIIRDNRAKEEEKRRTLRRPGPHRTPPFRLGPPVVFPTSEPQDYTDFVPKRNQAKSTSSEPEKSKPSALHVRSISEPEHRPLPSPSKPPVFESTDEGIELSTSRHNSQPATAPPDHAPTDYFKFEEAVAPMLPPRTWRNTSTSSSLSSSGTFGSNLTATVMSTPSAVSSYGGDKGFISTGGGVSPTPEGGRNAITSVPKNTSPNQSKSSLEQDLGKRKVSPPSSSVFQTPPTTIPEEQRVKFPTPITTRDTVPSDDSHTPVTPPPLPPRSPTKEKLSRRSSSSSSSSSTSSGRCPRCRSRKTKLSVGKTVSLDHRAAVSGKGSSPDDCRKSLPDLADANSIPENGLGGQKHRHAHRSREHNHCSKCSPGSSMDGIHNDSNQSLQSSSSQNFEYLQLVGEEHTSPTSSLDDELRPQLDLLSSCLQTLEYLEQKVNSTSNTGALSGTATMTTSVITGSSPSTSFSQHGGSMRPKVKPTVGDTRKAVFTQARKEAEMALADLQQPLTPSTSTHQRLGKAVNTLPSSYNHSENKKQVPNGHPLQLHKQKSLFGVSSLRNNSGNINGISHQRSSSSMGLTTPPASKGPAPPVPPRSMVSLTETVANSPPSPGLRQNQTRSASVLHKQTTPSRHQPPARSISAFGLHSRNAGHPSLTRRPNTSGQTVFIHHIKDRRTTGLTHLV